MLGQYLKQFRVKNNLTQQKMAESLGTSQAYYSQIESGAKNPGFTMVSKLAKVLMVEEKFSRSLL